MTDDRAAPEPDATCDGGDLDCGSGLLLIIRSAMAPLPPGGVLLVKSREVSVKEDLPAWCRMVGHGMLDARPADAGYTHYFVRKKDDDAALQQDLQRARDHVWQVRARWHEGMLAKVSVRNHGYLVGQPASFDTEDPAPSAIEFLLSAVAGAIATGLQWRLSQRSIEVRNLEVVAKARCRNSLVFLAVAEDGSPALAGVELNVYLDSDADEQQAGEILSETLRRCPVTQTVLTSVPVNPRLSVL
ncbi:MAG: OsmC family protein [Planctomycetes bacterium]|nr:OsmC family protein [Planctomycetota bacterium]